MALSPLADDRVGRMEFLLNLRRHGIMDAAVLKAMDEVPREHFVTSSYTDIAYADHALPIACGQTISQPYVVAYMTERLAVKPEHRVLEVGTGSGYAAAVLAELARSVASIERVPELAARARGTLAATGYDRVEVVVGDGSLGVPEKAPFHAIAVAAAAPRVPESLYQQLAQGGRLVVPIGSRADQRLVLVVRSPEGPAEARSLPCRYVPLLGAEGF